MSKSGIVNVRMVITEEKILSNIDKIQKLINPKSKKQIVQLEDDTYFKDLVESIKTYLIEYPKKKNFPASVYKASYGLVEYATNQFEENTKKIEELIRQREQNIALAGDLKELIETVTNKEKDRSKALSYIGIEIADALKSIPTPVEEAVVEEQIVEAPQTEQVMATEQQYANETTFEAKPSLWQRIKNSKIVRAVKAITRIRIVLDYSDALPEGRGENK